MTDDLPAALAALHDAIEDPGPMPGYHHAIMERHRAEWPTLWKAIDQLLEVERPA